MKFTLLLFLILPFFGVSQIKDYFKNNRIYTYNTLYIDSKGDTIIKGELKVCSSSKKWFFQPGLQKKVIYHYISDTASNNNYVDPSPFFEKKNSKRIKKKGTIGFDKTEVTGGFVYDSIFYMHPPRTNQFRILFYTPHPKFEFAGFYKNQHVFYNKITLYGFGVYNHKYLSTKSLSVELFGDSIKTWNVIVDSELEFKREKDETKKDLYNSTLKAKFCREYGFITLDYKFDNGIEIKFELVKVE